MNRIEFAKSLNYVDLKEGFTRYFKETMGFYNIMVESELLETNCRVTNDIDNSDALCFEASFETQDKAVLASEKLCVKQVNIYGTDIDVSAVVEDCKLNILLKRR